MAELKSQLSLEKKSFIDSTVHLILLMTNK
jgi:hypothetical protein